MASGLRVSRPLLYLDASALVKLIADEPESAALRADLGDAGIVSSEVAVTEVPRAIWRIVGEQRAGDREALLRGVGEVLEAVALVPLTRSLLVEAGSFEEPFLRALDAIHVASALTVADEVGAFVSYDGRQRKAAAQAGLPAVAPGITPHLSS